MEKDELVKAAISFQTSELSRCHWNLTLVPAQTTPNEASAPVTTPVSLGWAVIWGGRQTISVAGREESFPHPFCATHLNFAPLSAAATAIEYVTVVAPTPEVTLLHAIPSGLRCH